jgi:hypothetical protein
VSSSRADGFVAVTATPYRLVATEGAHWRHWQVHPVTALRIALLLLVIGQLGRIPVLSTGTSEAPLLVNDLCLLAVIAVTAISALAARSFRVDSIGGLALAFAAIGLVSALMAGPRFGLSSLELLVSVAYLARWLVYFAVYLVVINVVRGDDILPVWRTLETTMLIFAAFGIVQSIFLPHFAQLVYPDSRVFIDWDEQGHRLVSTVLEPNIAGSMIMLVLLIQIAQLAAGDRVSMWKPLLMFAALVATLSRSSFLGLAVGIAIVLVIRGISRRMLQLAGATGVLFLLALPKLFQFAQQYSKWNVSDASAMSRVVSWLRALRVWADHPLFGIGFNTYGYVVERYGGIRAGAASFSSDGGLLFIAVMTGVVGLALYLGILYLVVRRCRRVWRDPAAPVAWRSLAIGIAAGTVAICVHAAFVNSLLTPFVMEPLWLLWGFAFVMAQRLPRLEISRPAAALVACQGSA